MTLILSPNDCTRSLVRGVSSSRYMMPYRILSNLTSWAVSRLTAVCFTSMLLATSVNIRRCLSRRSLMNCCTSSSFLPADMNLSSESVIPWMAETTTTFSSWSEAMILPTLFMLVPSLRDEPPNFRTFILP